MPQTATSRRRLKLAAASCLAALLGLAPIFAIRAADPAAADKAPTTAPAGNAAPTTQRSREAIVADLQAASKDLQGLFQSRDAFTDAKKRAEVAPKAVPAMKKYLAAFDEMAQQDPMAKAQASRVRMQFLSMLTTLGDADAQKELKAMADGNGPEAAEARGGLLMSDWIKSEKDAATQTKLVDQLKSMVQANPKNDALAMMAMEMLNTDPADKTIETSLQKIITDDAQGPQAKQLAEQIASEQKLKAMEGKPLTLAGPTVDGKQFTTADWKGKVILVDFWATWCGPCREELPRVKKAYADFHDKGLEVLGVSCDQNAKALTDFLAKNPDMPWPQLFDEKTPGWHPIAKDFGIQGIPTMFLIDKKGILRTVEAREKFETEIPKLLDEK